MTDNPSLSAKTPVKISLSWYFVFLPINKPINIKTRLRFGLQTENPAEAGFSTPIKQLFMNIEFNVLQKHQSPTAAFTNFSELKLEFDARSGGIKATAIASLCARSIIDCRIAVAIAMKCLRLMIASVS